VSYDASKLYPGGTDVVPGYVNRPGTTYSSGAEINQIEQRWHNVIAQTTFIDQATNDFLQIDVARLMTIARAAAAMKSAKNAEEYRVAVAQLMASLR
jgi:hypothetical protein